MKGVNVDFFIDLKDGDKLCPVNVKGSVVLGNPGGAMTSWGFEPPEPDEVSITSIRDIDTGKAYDWESLSEEHQREIDETARKVAYENCRGDE